MRKLLIAIASVSFVVGAALTVPAQTGLQAIPRASQAAQSGSTPVSSTHATADSLLSGEFCNPTYSGGTGWCARDPSDAGIGTKVVTSDYTGTKAETWTEVLSSECNGYVYYNSTTNTSCPSLGLAKKYAGQPIYNIRNANGLCLGANSGTTWYVEMKSCGDTETDFIEGQCSSGYCYIASVKWNLTYGGTSYGWLCGSNAYNNPVYVSYSCNQGLEQWTQYIN